MSWSYNENDLGTTSTSSRLNAVRLLIGDTDTDDRQIENEEIVFALNQAGNNIYFAASWSAKSIAAKFSRMVTHDLDGALRADYSNLQAHYFTLAENLEYQGKKTGALVGARAGGVNKTTVDSVRSDTNRVKPSFRRDKFKNPPDYSDDDYDFRT
jgi:hypothetical protein